MRRGTKEIRKVFTGSREYYVYDLDKDFLENPNAFMLLPKAN